MKPDKQQVKLLQDYLHTTLSYQETYEEILDHILSALEHQPESLSFEAAVNNIINNDFGGAANLLKIEKVSKKSIVKECVGNFTSLYLSYFKFPAVGYTISFSAVIYYFISQMKFSPTGLAYLLAAFAVVPMIIWLLRLYNTGYILDTTKASAKDRLFETFAGIPVRVCVAVVLIANTPYYHTWESTVYYNATVLITLIVVYNLSLYKLYKRELTMAITK